MGYLICNKSTKSNGGFLNGKHMEHIYIYWLVVWNMNFIFPYIGNVLIPTDELIFFRGVGIPPTSISGTSTGNGCFFWGNHRAGGTFQPRLKQPEGTSLTCGVASSWLFGRLKAPRENHMFRLTLLKPAVGKPLRCNHVLFDGLWCIFFSVMYVGLLGLSWFWV